MTSKQQVKQSLELALSLAESLEPLTQVEAQEFFGILGDLNKIFSKTVDHAPKTEKSKKHPVDILLEKGKIQITRKRREQLETIFNELTSVHVEFLSAKQNHATNIIWFPLIWNGDKSAALYLGSSWGVEPLSIKANGELTGEWEGFDLIEFMAMNCPEFDEDDY